jgi:hypothetical protein
MSYLEDKTELRIETEKVARIIRSAIPEKVTLTCVILALLDVAAEYSRLLESELLKDQ